MVGHSHSLEARGLTHVEMKDPEQVQETQIRSDHTTMGYSVYSTQLTPFLPFFGTLS